MSKPFDDFDAAHALLKFVAPVAPMTPPSTPLPIDNDVTLPVVEYFPLLEPDDDCGDLFNLFIPGLLPISYNTQKIPVFSSEDISIWGPPQNWGFEKFEVVEMKETISPLVTD